MEAESVQPVGMNISQSNKYRKDLNWLHSNNEPKIEEKQQGKA